MIRMATSGLNAPAEKPGRAGGLGWLGWLRRLVWRTPDVDVAISGIDQAHLLLNVRCPIASVNILDATYQLIQVLIRCVNEESPLSDSLS
jgi:hypothetical protein